MVPSILQGGLESPGSGQRRTEGKQAGSLNHRAALPPLLPFGLDPDEHFEAACTIGQYPFADGEITCRRHRPPICSVHACQGKGFLEFVEEKGTGHLA